MIEIRSQEHVNLDQNLFLWLIQHQCQFTESVEKKKEKEKMKVEIQLHSAKKMCFFYKQSIITYSKGLPILKVGMIVLSTQQRRTQR